MQPILECGHAANALQRNENSIEIPVCAICIGIKGQNAKTIAAEQPDLKNRISKCRYYDPNFKYTY